MYLPQNYKKSPLWLTIDVEELTDANFGITPKKELNIDYEGIIDRWIELCERHNIQSTAFILGSFAQKYPQIVRKLFAANHEIACHGLRHELVYKLSFTQWRQETAKAKAILEDITGKEVVGYRSPSWTLPFQKRYYEALAQMGFAYSSSYFPFKTYMYGNTIDKKRPFSITTSAGTITEIPIPKFIIPFSGGFYMRVLPFFIVKTFFKRLMAQGIKPIIYTHPYELLPNLFSRFFKNIKIDGAYILTFANIADSYHRFETILELIKDKNENLKTLH